MKFFHALTCLIAALSMNAQASDLNGDSIDAAMIRTIDTGYGLGRITGYGLDQPFIVIDGPTDRQQYSNAFTLDVDAHGFSLQFLSTAGWQEGTVLRLSDLDFGTSGTNILSGVNVETNLTGYSLSTGSNYLEIVLGGTQFTESTYLNGTFVISAVPEPGVFTLLALAPVPMFLMAYRRVKRSSSSQTA